MGISASEVLEMPPRVPPMTEPSRHLQGVVLRTATFTNNQEPGADVSRSAGYSAHGSCRLSVGSAGCAMVPKITYDVLDAQQYCRLKGYFRVREEENAKSDFEKLL